MKKFTRASLKKFIRDNKDSLYICVKSSFSGMTDCVEQVDNGYVDVVPGDIDFTDVHTFGIPGLYLVGSSRDRFRVEDDGGITISNCCGHCTLHTKKEAI